jgi:hypothetical protein
MVYALWQALRNAIADGHATATAYPVQRAAFVIVFLVTVHSMLEYPLWYSYFLLPTAFAFGLCLERPEQSAGAALAARAAEGSITRPYVLAAMFLILGATLAVYDYMRAVVIFAAPAGAGSLEQGSPPAAGASCSATTPTTPPRPSPSTLARGMSVRARAPLPARHPLDDRVGESPRRARRDRQGRAGSPTGCASSATRRTEEFFAPCGPSATARRVRVGRQAAGRPARRRSSAGRPRGVPLRRLR